MAEFSPQKNNPIGGASAPFVVSLSLAGNTLLESPVVADAVQSSPVAVVVVPLLAVLMFSWFSSKTATQKRPENIRTLEEANPAAFGSQSSPAASNPTQNVVNPTQNVPSQKQEVAEAAPISEQDILDQINFLKNRLGEPARYRENLTLEESVTVFKDRWDSLEKILWEKYSDDPKLISPSLEYQLHDLYNAWLGAGQTYDGQPVEIALRFFQYVIIDDDIILRDIAGETVRKAIQEGKHTPPGTCTEIVAESRLWTELSPEEKASLLRSEPQQPSLLQRLWESIYGADVPMDHFHVVPLVGTAVSWGLVLYLKVLKPYGPAFYHGFFKPLVWDPFKLVVQYLADALKPYVGPVAIAAFVGGKLASLVGNLPGWAALWGAVKIFLKTLF